MKKVMLACCGNSYQQHIANGILLFRKFMFIAVDESGLNA